MVNIEISTEELVYRLVYMAFLEIREASREENLNRARLEKSADVFHNVPLQLYLVSKGELSAEDVLTDILSRARRRGVENWIVNLVDHERETWSRRSKIQSPSDDGTAQG